MIFESENIDFGNNFLWKYLNIHKFLYLIQEKKLFFTRLDMFEDPNEGLTEELIRRIYEREKLFPAVENLNPELFPTEKDRQNAALQNQLEKQSFIKEAGEIQKRQYASCWFMGNRESYAMWNIYSNPDSVVVRFNPVEFIQEIKSCIEKSNDETCIDKIIAGPVHYTKVYPPEYDMRYYETPKNKYSAFKKDSSYVFENEYRIIAINNKFETSTTYFELNLENLYDLDFKVISHPKMEKWMYKNISRILSPLKLEDRLWESDIKLKPSS